MDFIKTDFEGLLIIEPNVFSDFRGEIRKSYQFEIFNFEKLNFNVKEIIETTSKKGVIRGLHFQKEFPQAKLIQVIKGKLFDVVVDLRENSSTFGKAFSIVLEEKGKCLYVPKGFAHGCQILEDNTTFVYSCSDIFREEDNFGIAYDDPSLQISWPINDIKYILISEKDKNLPTIAKLTF